MYSDKRYVVKSQLLNLTVCLYCIQGSNMSWIYEKNYHSNGSNPVAVWRDGNMNTVHCKEFTECDGNGRVVYHLHRRPQYSRIHK